VADFLEEIISFRRSGRWEEVDQMNEVIKECDELMRKYGHMPFDKALPHLRAGWWAIAEKHGMTGPEVLEQYLNWKSNQS
jgi:hypothetical protein